MIPVGRVADQLERRLPEEAPTDSIGSPEPAFQLLQACSHWATENLQLHIRTVFPAWVLLQSGPALITNETALIAQSSIPAKSLVPLILHVNFMVEALLKHTTMHTKRYLRLSFALLLLLVVETFADDDDTDFLMNVFSDLGPVLALFGEQFARQFLSETFTWYDHVIFACAPLGIMTAIAGAIRVQGPKLLKAFIGRARENKAAAEIEYMSSTSAEVGELFNGRGIVRTMGQPEIAQFIIFPNELLREKKDENIQSYGIHTLKSASDEDILQKEVYCDELDLAARKAARNWLKSFKGEGTPKKDAAQAEKGSSYSFSPIKRASPLEKNDSFPKYWKSLNSPNLQLNIATESISPRQRSIELHLAAIVAFILQVSLLVVAGVVPYRAQDFEAQPWGLPCYVGGSVLLVIGMLACSVAIERSTSEFKWRSCSGTAKDTQSFPEGLNPPMDLIWVQRTQRVSDQDFKSYLIYSQAKKFISTSSRREDIRSEKSDREKNTSSEIDTHPIYHNSSNETRISNKTAYSHDDQRFGSNLLAITAILAGGAGFTIQFIGLRGLPWPCAVAQLGAIIIMAIIRALIRRRLGDGASYCQAPSRYELDLLATQLVDSLDSRPPEQPFQPPTHDWTWRVDTAEQRSQRGNLFCFATCPNPSTSRFRTEAFVIPQSARKSKAQKIMLARRRLGDLAQWETEAFEPALALARSIERFMDEFMPPTSDENPVEWKVPMKDFRGTRSVVTLEITKEVSGGWKIKVGELEAVLALWMAHLDATEAAKKKDKKNTEWQRSKAGVTLGVDYCRIIGPSDQRGILERDIKWWVGNPAVTEITVAKKEEGNTAQANGGPFQRREALYQSDDPEPEDIKMIIGFMGPLGPEKTHKLLVQHSTAALAEIVAQHLFTSFIGTIVDRDHFPKDFLDQGSINIHELVSIQPPKPLDLESSKVTTGRKLSHTKLTRFVLHAEKEGLGVMDDILLCLIPVFSLKDVLPNDAIFKFDLPSLQDQSAWQKGAGAYLALLKFIARGSPCYFDEFLSLSVVVHALDYIYLMALNNENMVYGKALSRGDDTVNESMSNDFSANPRSLSRQSSDHLRNLMEHLSKLFPDALKRLLALYKIQGRENCFYELKRLCGEDVQTGGHGARNGDEAFMRQIRFTTLHQNVSEIAHIDLRSFQEKDWKKRDIFGWTALHYAASCKEFEFSDDRQYPVIPQNPLPGYLKDLLQDGHPQTWWLDNFSRSPVHVASLTGNHSFLENLLASLSKNDVRSSLEAKGLDGMTPVHLAMKGGHANCIAVIKKAIDLQQLKMPTDAWKRNPIHLAVAKGEYGCCGELISDERLVFNPYTLDIHGKSLFSYLDEEKDEQRSFGRLLLDSHLKAFGKKDNEGQSVWHYAVKFLDEDRIGALKDHHNLTINDRNNSGETPLHLAVKRRNKQLVDRLLELGATTGINSDKDQSPLMFACSRGEAKMVESMLDKNKQAAKEVDKEGKSPLHYAIECKSCNDEDRVKIAKRLVSAMKSIDIEDRWGRTPLHVACQNSHSSIVSILLEKMADPSVKDDKGNNALHYAVGLRLDLGKTTFTWREDVVEKLLKSSSDCINDQNEDGDTALFLAIKRDEEDASIFLLNNNADPQIAPDKSHPTPFMWACMHGGPLGFISKMVERAGQPGHSFDLNQGDLRFDQSPLAWACEANRTEVVKVLLETSKSDQLENKLEVNKPAKGYNNYTPLHLVLIESNHGILRLLLDDTRITRDLGATECDDLNLLEFASERSDENCLTTLLLHHHTKSTIFFMKGWERIVQKHASQVDDTELWKQWERAILDPRNNVQFPIHKLAEAGRKEIIEELMCQSGMNFHEPDEDNWTPADIAGRYHHKELEELLLKNDPREDLPMHKYCEPSTFFDVYKEPKLSISSDEPREPPLSFVLNVTIPPSEEGMDCYLRTREAIPPDLKHFYYEISIVEATFQKFCVFGFCPSFVPRRSLPGWHTASWAYHGDDGGLFIEGGWPTRLESAETFGVGDIVGCGMNFETGEGYRTKNGLLLDSGDSFENHNFLSGKFYPCLGVRADSQGTEMRIRITLRATEEYPFYFKGPYDGRTAKPRVQP